MQRSKLLRYFNHHEYKIIAIRRPRVGDMYASELILGKRYVDTCERSNECNGERLIVKYVDV